MENEVFENTIRILVIEERENKKDVKKKTKEIKRLKNDMENAMKMVEGMKDEYNKKLRENDVKIEQAKMTVSGADAYNEMVKKEEHDKVTESKQHENEINAINLNYDQVLMQLKNKNNEILTLKEGSGKNKVTDEARSEERKHEFRKHIKKEG